MIDELLLHETPLIRAFFKRLRCLLKGGHKHIYVGRTYLDANEQGRRYNLSYICAHCRHYRYDEEVEA